MSFGTRLGSFFVLIVALPMVAVGFLVFRLTSDSAHGKAAARAAASRPRRQAIYQQVRRGTDRRRDDRSRRRLADWAGAASPPVGEDPVIADADRALYVARRQGKNQTVQSQPESANVFAGR